MIAISSSLSVILVLRFCPLHFGLRCGLWSCYVWKWQLSYLPVIIWQLDSCVSDSPDKLS